MATTSDDVRLIRQYFIDTWQSSSVPFIFDNEPTIERPLTIWARFSVVAGLSKTISLFPKHERETGRAYLNVHVNRGTGTGTAQALIDAFKTAFKQANIDNHRIRMFEVQSSNDDSDPDWFILSATVRYQAEH